MGPWLSIAIQYGGILVASSIYWQRRGSNQVSSSLFMAVAFLQATFFDIPISPNIETAILSTLMIPFLFSYRQQLGGHYGSYICS